MKKYVMVLSLLFFMTQVTTQVTFAQTAAQPTPSSAGVLAQVANPTPTTVVTKPTIAPTTAPTAVQPTAVPTVSQSNPTPPTQQVTQANNPTPTPTQTPPTPTPKPLVITNRVNRIKPPSNPISQIITAPFNLVINSLPQDYYNDAGLAPTTTRILLAAGLLSIICGTVLLKWPSLVKVKNRLFAPTYKERPYYVAGRV